MATAGSLPPLSSNGKTFINDPKITGSTETKGSIKLKFLTPRNKEVLIVRNFQLTLKKKKYEFKRLEQVLKSINSNGELVTINSTCMDIDKQVPLLMHASKAILENVIFCHQEEINWPFSESGNLKKVFDEIFDTAKYTKALDDLKDIGKKFKEKTKDTKSSLELIQKDFENYKRIQKNIEFSNAKINELTLIGTKLEEEYQDKKNDLEKLLNIEKQYTQYQNGVNMAKTKRDEKMIQMKNILDDPLFEDYTKDEAIYHNYIKSYQENEKLKKEGATQSNEKHNKLIFLKEEIAKINKQKSDIEKNMIKKEQTYKNYIQNKKDILIELKNMNELEEINNSTLESITNEKIISILNKYKADLATDENTLDEKLKQFISKVTEKENEIQVNKQLYENKIKEIDGLNVQKNEQVKMMNNIVFNSQKLNDVEKSLQEEEKKLNKINFDIKQWQNNILALENSSTEIKLKKNSLGLQNLEERADFTMLKFKIEKLKQMNDTYNRSIVEYIKIVTKISQIFNVNLTYDKEHICSNINEIISFIENKKKSIVEEKQKIRENNLRIILEIEQNNNLIISKKKYVENITKEKINLISKIQNNFKEHGIIFENSDDLSQIYNLKSCVEKKISNYDKELYSSIYETDFLSEFISYIKENQKCKICKSGLDSEHIDELCERKKYEIQNINDNLEENKKKLDKNKKTLNLINNFTDTFTKLKNLTDELKKEESNLNDISFKNKELINKKTKFENSSKDKTELLLSMEEITNNKSTDENIYKLKNLKEEIILEIKDLCNHLGIPCKEEPEINETVEIIVKMGDTVNQILEMNKELINNGNKINELNHNINDKLNEIPAIDICIKNLQNEKKEILALKDENEIKKRIKYIDDQINLQNGEKLNLENEREKSQQLLIILNEKKKGFEKIYREKKNNIKLVQEKISQWLIKNKYIYDELYKSLKDEVIINKNTNNGNGSNSNIFNDSTNSSDNIEHDNGFKINNQKDFDDILMDLDEENYNNKSKKQVKDNSNNKTSINKENKNPNNNSETINLDSLYEKQTNDLNKKKSDLDTQLMLYNKELEELSWKAKEIEDQKKQEQIKKNIYNNNYILFKIKSDLVKLEQFIREHEGKLKDGSKLATIKVTLTKKVEELSNTINKNIGKVEELKNNLNRLSVELKNGTYTNIEKKYNKLKLNYIASIQTQKEIESYYEALDQSLLKYHGKRMEEINKLINYYWSMTYKGNDIKGIEIKSDFEKSAKTRNYNYRIVFFTAGGQGLDMRGRCSAGQKILASIIIRLALAETFCNNCGILCLDEPTTNLDEDNSKSLAKALREIIQSRSEDQNFQLIVITHDPVFVDLLGSDYCDNFWQVSKNKENFSTLTLKPINSIFNQ